MTLENAENILIRNTKRLLDERANQRINNALGGIEEGNTLFIDDEVIQAIDQREREFQKDFPINEADLLGMSEFGSNEADLQQVSAGRIESLAALDAAGIGSAEKGSKVFSRARADLLPQKVNAWLELPDGKTEYVGGENAPNEIVSDDMKEATKLQEWGLARPKQQEVPYQTFKNGSKRRNFGVVQKTGEGANREVLKTRMKRVRQPKRRGQAADGYSISWDENGNKVITPDVISVDNYETAQRSRYRQGFGDNGPTGEFKPQMTTGSALVDAYNEIMLSVQTGQVDLDDLVDYKGPLPDTGGLKPANLPGEQVSNQRTVRDVLIRMEESMGGHTALQRARFESANTAIADMKGRKERARRQLREIALQAKAEGNPLSREEAVRLLQDLNNPKERTDIKFARQLDDLALSRSYGGQNTAEVIGETQMSDEAWKSSSTKVLPVMPVRSKAQTISNDQVYAMQNAEGQIVGHSDGRNFIGEVNTPDSLQNLNVPSNQKNLINFITENLQYDDKGALKPATITQATQDFTDIARNLSEERFGAGVSNIPNGIHSYAEAQAFFDRLIERGKKAGTSFSRFNPEKPSEPLKVPSIETPTVSDLMSTMNVDRSTQGRLATALYSMGLAEGIDINQEGKKLYAARQGSYQPVFNPAGYSESVDLDARSRGEKGKTIPGRQNITFDSPAGVFFDGVEAAYIPNSQRKVIDGKSINIQAALRKLDDPMAREPFIGAVAREAQPKETYRKGFGKDITIEQGYRDLERKMAKGKRGYSQARVDANIAQAQAIEKRFERGEENRAVRRVMRQADEIAWADNQRFLDVVEDINEDKNRQRLMREMQYGNDIFPGQANRAELLKRIAEGESFPESIVKDDGFRVATDPVNFGPKQLPRTVTNRGPSTDPMIAAQARRISMSPKQPIQEAKVAPSIAPDPWAGTGPARMETAVQQPQQDQQLALPKARSPQQNDFKGGFANAMMQKELQDRANREKFRNRAGIGAAAAAGATAGLAALIGGERDQREQEQY